MLDLNTSREVIVREWDKFINRLQSMSNFDWSAPVRCEGWSIADLVAHAAWGISMETDALHRMREGVSEPANGFFKDPSTENQILVEAVKTSRNQLAAELQQLTLEDMSKLAPMPYGPIPAMFALQVFVMEAGVHGDDLADALRQSEGLNADVITATAAVLTGSLPVLAQASKETPISKMTYRLSGEHVSIELSYQKGQWQIGQVDDQPECQIFGYDSDLLLFALGRISPKDSMLTIAGDVELAMKFKVYFPGP